MMVQVEERHLRVSFLYKGPAPSPSS